MKLSLAEKVRQAHKANMHNYDIGKKFGISTSRVGRIVWEMYNHEHRQAYETKWKRDRYQNDEKYRARRIRQVRRYRARLREELRA